MKANRNKAAAPSVDFDTVRNAFGCDFYIGKECECELQRSNAAISSHVVTKLHYATLVSLDLREMEGNVSAEVLKKLNAVANKETGLK